MADHGVPEGVIPQSFICPITQELMSDPVLLIADSQSYERSALKEWFDTGRRISPMTGLLIGSTNIKTNYALKTGIEVFSSFVVCCLIFARFFLSDLLTTNLSFSPRTGIQKFSLRG